MANYIINITNQSFEIDVNQINQKYNFNLPKLKFSKVCDYSDCYNPNGNNNYNRLDQFAYSKGLHIFADKDLSQILYIGDDFEQDFKTRLQQHFIDKDTGGLRYKFKNDPSKLKLLEDSTIYICPLPDVNKNDLNEMREKLKKVFQPILND
ncbi:MAG: hypothetical protein IKP67_00120 [Spirochaetales bacterium]|nr:hypothetical protein [Spirochaetales bacterium]